MSNIAVVYFSNTGNTEQLAEAVADGAREAGAEVSLFAVSEFDAASVSDFDAYAFGCCACGTEELDEGEFLPVWDEVKGDLADKPVALFGSYGWGGGEYMEVWKSEEAADLNVVGTVTCEGEPDDEALSEAKALGASLA